MLKPADLTTKQYPVALKPTDSYEEQLLYSLQQPLQVGVWTAIAANSGVYTPSVADVAQLAVTPLELAVVLDNNIDSSVLNGGSGITPVITITGTDVNNAAVTGTATFASPAYAQTQVPVFCKTFAAEATTTPTAGTAFKTITGVTMTGGAELAPVKFVIIGLPPLSSFVQVATKTKLDWALRVPMPHSIASGRDKSKYIKPGEIEEGTITITARNPNWGDGLARINGIRVTGLVKEVKEDQVDVVHIFLLGMILTWKASGGESTESVELTANGLYELSAFIPAH